MRRLEQETGKAIYVRGRDDVHAEDLRVLTVGSRSEVERQALPVREGQVVDLQVEQAHANNPHDGIARVEGYVVDIEGAGRHVGQRLKVEITRVYRTFAKARMLPGA